MKIKNSLLNVSVIQLNSTENPLKNILRIAELLDNCMSLGCELAVLPENCLCHGKNSSIIYNSRTLDKWNRFINSEIGKLDFPVVWGGLPVLYGKQRFNTSVVMLKGTPVAIYRKNHLFSHKKSDDTEIKESDIYTPGDLPLKFTLKGWEIGLSICFDIRFPEFFRKYNYPDIIICCSAFTYKTGKDHWKLLLRARAVDNQCYVLGANQYTAETSDFPATYGHSMIVDPWGKVIGNLSNGDGVLTSELKKVRISASRNRIKIANS